MDKEQLTNVELHQTAPLSYFKERGGGEVLAPIALFTYNRPQHTQQTLDALANNKEAKDSTLYVFCDGAKTNATEETLKKISDVKQIVKNEKRFKEIIVKAHTQNNGLANSIIAGVTEVVNKHEKVIVLEDDLVTAPFFLQFMNDALNTYTDNTDVACISGYIYPVKNKLPQTFFIKGADCWGWATWKRAWNNFENDGKKLLKELEEKKLTHAFDFNDSYPYTHMLKEQIEGKNNSWAIRWYATAFLKNKYCLYPSTSLVQNIGTDGTGTHSGVSDGWKVNLVTHKIAVNKIAIEENAKDKQIIIDYFNSLKGKKSFLKKAILKNFTQKINHLSLQKPK